MPDSSCFWVSIWPRPLALARSMAAHKSQNCLECGISMPFEDGHDQSLLCLGPEHALLAIVTPKSCMNCLSCQHGLERPLHVFLPPAITTQTHTHDPPTSHVPEPEVGRKAATGVEAEHAIPRVGFLPLSTDLPARPALFPPMAPPLSLGRWRMAIRWRTLMKCLSSPLATLTCPLDGRSWLPRHAGQVGLSQIMNKAFRVLELALPSQ